MIAPAHPREPLILTPPPEYPFQQICADYLHVSGHQYLTIVDRFSGWLCIFHFSPHNATSTSLINECRQLFSAYGAPEQFCSDGGPQFTSMAFKAFLSDWNVEHRISSATYAQSNGRAELGVKTAKRIIHGNTATDGSLNHDKAAQAILQYRNTPLPLLNLSPAQILLHRQLRDTLPNHPSHFQLHKEWILSAQDRERLFYRRNSQLISRYNEHAHSLPPLQPQARVIIHNNNKGQPRWKSTGVVVETLPFRRYRIKLDGSGRIVCRNRRFLQRCMITPTTYIPSPSIPCPVQPPHHQSHHTLLMTPNNNTTPTRTPMSTSDAASRPPLALRRLLPHNNPGFSEMLPLQEGRRGSR